MPLSKAERRAILSCALFEGLNGPGLTDALSRMGARRRRYAEGELIFPAGGRLTRCGIVLSGEVMISSADSGERSVRIDRFGPGKLFGHAMVCAGIAESPVEMRCAADCTVLWLDLSPVLDCGETVCRTLALNLMRDFARQNVLLSVKVRILSQKRLRPRIRLWLLDQPAGEDGVIRLPFSKTEWASQLGVDRTALARELSRMRDEGLIEVGRREIRLLRELPGDDRRPEGKE